MFTDLQIPAGRRPMSRNEARISAIVGIAFAVMILAAVFEEYSASRMSVLFVVLFWVPMLILHELGHAFAAWILGWRVREIVIGFGRDLWQWRYGETRVRIKLAPVEGYVLPMPKSSHHIRIKSMLIYAAGPGAELLLLAIMLLVLGADYVFGASDDLAQIATQSLAIAILLGAGFNLLPFSTGGGVSDGLGILSSPFMSDESIELRLLAVELREISTMLDAGNADGALESVREYLARFPENPALQQLMVSALSASGAIEAAREYVRDKLDDPRLAEPQRLQWFHRQARVELFAAEPSWLVLDLALQKSLAISPNNLDALATKGASQVLRGQVDAGGTLLADVWRRNNGHVRDEELLAFLAIAAHKSGHDEAADRFRQAFDQINHSVRLQTLVERQN